MREPKWFRYFPRIGRARRYEVRRRRKAAQFQRERVTIKPFCERIYRTGNVTIPSAQSAFPDRGHAPTGIQQRLLHTGIIVAVSSDFVCPEFSTGAWQTKKNAIVSVPETSMDKNDSMPSGKHNVRLTRKIATVDAKPESSAVK